MTLLERMTVLEQDLIFEAIERAERRRALPPELRPERRSGLLTLLEKGREHVPADRSGAGGGTP